MIETVNERRLAAILAADVVGYSRLMDSDEAGTLAALNNIWTHHFNPRIAAHQGRVVKMMGDGALVEFSSALYAVEFAIAFQTAMMALNEEPEISKRIEFRIGINLGDIIAEGDDIFGDGVNIAARLESLAPINCVLLSGSVYQQTKDKIDAAFSDVGGLALKNIEAPVQAWCWGADDAALRRLVKSPQASTERPSIAVLPFENLSDDPDQEYFADGLTEDIITSLSKVRWFFVISRNSTFAFKGRTTDPRDIGEELGVRYVLEGSVRTAGNRVRLSAQLIDCTSGNNLWAERYHREIEDIFDLQDELTQTVVGAIEPQLSKAERDRARMRKPNNLDAWNMLQYGRAHLYKRSRKDLAQARTFLEEAIKHDPELVAAYSDLAEVCFLEVRLGFAEDNTASLAKAVELSNKAIEIKGEDAAAHYALGRVLSMKRRHAEAERELNRAIELNPSYSQAYLALGMSYAFSGRAEEAIEPLDTGMRLSPHDEYMGPFMARTAEAYLFMGNHKEAVEWGRRAALQPHLPWPGFASLVSILGHLGEDGELVAAIAELEKRAPKIDLAYIRQQLPITNERDLDHMIEGLRKAGLPES